MIKLNTRVNLIHSNKNSRTKNFSNGKCQKRDFLNSKPHLKGKQNSREKRKVIEKGGGGKIKRK